MILRAPLDLTLVFVLRYVALRIVSAPAPQSAAVHTLQSGRAELGGLRHQEHHHHRRQLNQAITHTRTLVKMRSTSVGVSALPSRRQSRQSFKKFLPSMSTARCMHGACHACGCMSCMGVHGACMGRLCMYVCVHGGV